MSTSTLIRWSGLAAILGGLSLIPPSVSLQPPWSWIGSVGMVFLVLGLIGIYAVQVEQSGVAGFLGFLLTLAGSVYLIGSGGDIAGIPFWLLGSILSGLGMILLAIGTLKSGKFPRWIPWLWIAAVIVGLPSAFIPSLVKTLGILGSVVAATGMTGAGYILWSRPKA